MGKWRNILDKLRAAGAIAGMLGVKVKGVPISVIQDEAERDGAVIVDSVKRLKAVPKPPAAGSTGE